MTWTLTGFADEISPDPEVQLRTLAEESQRFLELRGAWGINVADFDDTHVSRLRDALDHAGVAVSAIGSPIGKTAVTEPIGPELQRLRRVADIAHRFDTSLVRVFSFFLPDSPGAVSAGAASPDAASPWRDEVVDRMGALAEVAAESGVVLAHENEKGIFGDIPARCADLIASVDSPSLRSTFDAANFVQCGVRPYDDAYDLIRPSLVYVQIKDTLAATGRVVPAGAGDGQVSETLATLRDSSFDGFFSIEPHLAAPDRSDGPAMWHLATEALKGLLDELGVTYR